MWRIRQVEGAAFNYQGQLTDNPDGAGANGMYDLVFTAHDAEGDGNELFEGFGPPISHD